jgi:hypothetical protein
VPKPGPVIIDLGSEPLGDAAKQLPEQRQRQSATSLAVCRASE